MPMVQDADGNWIDSDSVGYSAGGGAGRGFNPNAATAGANAGAGILGGLGSVLGYFLGQGDRDQARQDMQNAVGAYRDAQFTPQAASDPAIRGSQLEALQQLRQIYQSGGLDPQTRAQLAEVQQSNAQAAQAANARTQNEMAQRGLSASGAAYSNANNQAAANADNMQGMQAAALGSQRQMQALQGAGSLAGGIRSADDAINQFNAGGRNQFNEWQTGGEAGAYGNQAAYNLNDANKLQQMGYGVGSGLGAAAGYAAGGPLTKLLGG